MKLVINSRKARLRIQDVIGDAFIMGKLGDYFLDFLAHHVEVEFRKISREILHLRNNIQRTISQ
jgi:hypothetical protein